MKVLRVTDNKLYTPVVGYRRNGLEVTAIGAIHIGSRDYYQRLQREVDKHDEGFFEGLKPPRAGVVIPPEREIYLQRINLSELYRTFSRYTGMVRQRDMLTYGVLWQNPDMTLDELVIAFPERMLRKFSRQTDTMEAFEEIYENHPEELARFLKSLTLAIYKFPLVRNFVTRLILGHMSRKAILDQRNSMLFDAVQPRLDNEDFSGLGITYGPQHLNGIEAYLKRNGFTREGDFWFPAWEITETPSFLKSLLTVLNDRAEEKTKRRNLRK